jgi:REP element-mobilizing transposase RayT
MARPLRIEYEGALYHVTARGNAGTKIYLEDADHEHFLEILRSSVKRFRWICHAYCLLDNHYHLLVETPEPNLSRGMQYLNGVYTQWFNRRHERYGHLFQGRFKSIVVEKESYLLELARYIVLNPVRAGLVRSARDWRWSSYRATSGQADTPDFLTTDWLLSQFGNTREEAIGAYRAFVKQGRGLDVWSDRGSGVLLGRDAFVQRMRPLLSDVSENREFKREDRLAGRPTLDELFEGALDKPTRNQRIYAAVRQHGYRLKEVGDHLGLCYSTISIIAKRVEQEREP